MSEKTKICLEPIGDRVLVKPDAEKEQVDGIYIPDTAKEKPKEGTVVAVGPGMRDVNGEVMELQTQIGDRVLMNKFGGVEVELNDEKYTLLNEHDLLGILKQ